VSDRNPLVVNVEADERTVLFPAGKFLTHIAVQGQDPDAVRMDAIYTFNDSQEPCEIAVLESEDARSFARAIMDGVYQGRSQHVINNRVRIMLVFNPNGFVITFGKGDDATDLYICAAAIVRLAHAVLRVTDRLKPAQAH
jgi:hypothetical protein